MIAKEKTYSGYFLCFSDRFQSFQSIEEGPLLPFAYIRLSTAPYRCKSLLFLICYNVQWKCSFLLNILDMLSTCVSKHVFWQHWDNIMHQLSLSQCVWHWHQQFTVHYLTSHFLPVFEQPMCKFCNFDHGNVEIIQKITEYNSQVMTDLLGDTGGLFQSRKTNAVRN